MHPILLEPPIEAHPRLPISNPPASYDSILRESVDRFLIGIRGDSCDFSAFRSIFSRLIQSGADPPIEIVWFYAAVVHHERVGSKRDVLDRVVAVRDLLQLLIACSASCGGPKSVGIVAPVVSELYHVIVEVEGMGEKGCGKEARKVRREVERLVEGVMGYVSICSGKGFDGMRCGDLLPCFGDVIRVWTAKQGSGGGEMERLFPLVNDDIRAGFGDGRCGVEYLAGMVAVQAFLLRVLMKLEVGGVSKVELEKELRAWAVGMVTGFGNLIFFEILMKLLLDSKLPTVIPSKPKDETILRQILYDSALLVEYTFLCPSEVEKPCDSLEHLALLRLIVYHEAVQVARKNGDHNKAIAYTNAFSSSHLPSKLVQWVNNQTGRSNLTQPNATTPQALIKWLLSLQKKGFRVLEDAILAYCQKLCFDDRNFKLPGEEQMIKAENQGTSEDLFFVDTKGDIADDMSEQHEMELAGDAFVSAARAMKSERNSSKKRKGAKGTEGKAQTKFVKYKLHDTAVKDYFSTPATNDASSGSEVENPLSEEDMAEMEE